MIKYHADDLHTSLCALCDRTDRVPVVTVARFGDIDVCENCIGEIFQLYKNGLRKKVEQQCRDLLAEAMHIDGINLGRDPHCILANEIVAMANKLQEIINDAKAVATGQA